MATISDVARSAGVSLSTVSYVLSGKRSISEPTRTRVLDAVALLGYRPNAGARALASASNRTGVIGLVVPLHEDADVNVVMQFVRAVTTTARRHEADVLLLTQEDSAGLERVTATALVDGLVVLDIAVEDPRIGLLAGLGRPVVLIGLPRETQGLSCVDFDFALAARTAVDHLARLGHTSIGLVSSSTSSVHQAGYADRLQAGFLDQAASAGLRVATQSCDPTAEAARTCLDGLRAQQPDLTALVVHHETALPHLVSTLEEQEVRIPRDLSLVSVGAAGAATGLPQPVDVVEVPIGEMGRVAVEMLSAQISGDATPEVRLLSSPLIAQGGSAPPPAS